MSPTRKNDAYLRGQDPDDYDKAVYENTPENWLKIFGAFICFYIFQAFHWWCNFELGINMSESSTIYNIAVFLSAVLVISYMLCTGAEVNAKKIEQEFWKEKILQEEQRLQEEKERAEAKKANEEKIAKLGVQKSSVAPSGEAPQ